MPALTPVTTAAQVGISNRRSCAGRPQAENLRPAKWRSFRSALTASA